MDHARFGGRSLGVLVVKTAGVARTLPPTCPWRAHYWNGERVGVRGRAADRACVAGRVNDHALHEPSACGPRLARASPKPDPAQRGEVPRAEHAAVPVLRPPRRIRPVAARPDHALRGTPCL